MRLATSHTYERLRARPAIGTPQQATPPTDEVLPRHAPISTQTLTARHALNDVRDFEHIWRCRVAAREHARGRCRRAAIWDACLLSGPLLRDAHSSKRLTAFAREGAPDAARNRRARGGLAVRTTCLRTRRRPRPEHRSGCR